MTLGKRLHEARYAKGYKLRKVATLTGVSPSTISRAERDISPLLGSDALIALAACYGVSVGSLLGEQDAITNAGDGHSVDGAKIWYVVHVENKANFSGYSVEHFRAIAYAVGEDTLTFSLPWGGRRMFNWHKVLWFDAEIINETPDPQDATTDADRAAMQADFERGIHAQVDREDREEG